MERGGSAASLELIELRVLGPLEVGSGEVGAPKPTALLALLAARFGEVVPAERAADDIWSGSTPERAAGSLQVAVSGIRKRLKDTSFAVVTKRPGYVLSGPADRFDATVFEELVTAGRKALLTGRPEVASDRFRAALQLWRGDAYSGIDVPQVTAEADRLEELRILAEESAIQAELDLGAGGPVVARVEQLVERFPLRESMWRLLMLALYRGGRQADALDAFERLRSRLREELGADPSSEIRNLHRAILLQIPELEAPSAALTQHTARGNAFVGRRNELAELGEILKLHRLVSVVGIGGSGKTRLVRELLDRSSSIDHVLVELAGVSVPDVVRSAIAVTAGLREAPGSTVVDAIRMHFEAAERWLVLDNCEHVLPTVRDLVASMPGARILMTSREPLGLQDEYVWRVPPLELQESIELFNDRSFEGTDDMDAIAELCSSLDGIPLAVELAAARTKMMSPAQISQRLAAPNRLLERDAGPARQRTMSAAIEWSVASLDDKALSIFRRCSAFMGPFDLDDTETVCCFGELARQDAVPALATLVNSSLLTLDRDDNSFLYRMLIPIKHVAAAHLDKVGEEPAVQELHFKHFAAMASDLARAEARYDDLRAALEWSLSEGDAPQGGARLAASLSAFWQTKGLLTEGRAWLKRATAATPDPDVKAGCLAAFASMALMQSDISEAATALDEALGLANEAGNHPLLARIHLNLGALAHMTGHSEGEVSHMSQAVDAAKRAGDDDLLMRALNNLGLFSRRRGDIAQAESNYLEALQAARRLRSEMGESSALLNLADIARMKGDVKSTQSLAQEALRLARRAGFTQGVAGALGTLGTIAVQAGEFEVAGVYTKESLELARQIGDRNFEATSLANLGSIAQEGGNRDEAAGYFEQYLEAAEQIRDPRHISRASKALAECSFEAGNLTEAKSLLHRALSLATEMKDKPIIVEYLPLTAAVLAKDAPDLAVEIMRASDRAMRDLGITPDPSAARLIDSVRSMLDAKLVDDQTSLEETLELALESLHTSN